MRFKKGDKVKVRNNLVVDKLYGSAVFVSSMEKYCGKTAEIKEVSYYEKTYVLAFGDVEEGWCWTDDMLEPIEERYEVIVHDRTVIVLDGKNKGVAKCNPMDKFDLTTGISLAIERLNEAKNKFWKPSIGQGYYTPDINEYISREYHDRTWRNDNKDKVFYANGIVCKTKEEAIALRKTMVDAAKRYQESRGAKQ